MLHPSRRLGTGSCLTLLLASIPIAEAQTVRGILLDDKTGNPVFGASVVLVDSAERGRSLTISDSSGRFQLQAPTPGHYKLLVKRLGYRSDRSPTLPLRADQTLDLEFLIAPHPAQLAQVTVTGVAGAATRQMIAGMDTRSLGSRLIAPQKIEPLLPRARTVTDIIRWQNIPGLWITEEGMGNICVRLLRGRVSLNLGGVMARGDFSTSADRAAGTGTTTEQRTPAVERDNGCMEVYVNDVRFVELQALNPSDIHTIAILEPNEAGAIYGTGSAKGVLLIYTR